MTVPAVQHAVDAAFREERSRVVATLIRRTGDGDLAEECAQEAFTGAAAPMAEIEHNGYYSPTLAGDHARRLLRGAFLSFAAIAGDSPDNAGTTLHNQGPGSGHRTFPGRSRWRSPGFRCDCGASGQVAERAWLAGRSPLSG
jgi:hypothetical protein